MKLSLNLEIVKKQLANNLDSIFFETKLCDEMPRKCALCVLSGGLSHQLASFSYHTRQGYQPTPTSLVC